jgi:hypothetical protein
MTWKRWPRRILGGVVAATAVLLALVAFDRAAPKPTAAEPSSDAAQPFHSDPKHLWNRIHYRFHFRFVDEIAAGPDKLALDPDEHDATLWTRFPDRDDYLLGGPAHRDALALLDEFLTKEGEKLESDSVKRALLQHDLWALFDWVSSPEGARHDRKPLRNERRELYRRLARAIGRLALTDAQIAKLPDNYAAAVAAKKYPSQFDPDRKGQAFLPPDLWDPEGPWVLLGEWAANPLAIRHVDFFEGRSAFAVFLRLPAGRAATLKYLEELRAWKPKDGEGAVPQVPPRTQVALARRMMLVNDSGEIVPTRLTEMLQIRVLHEPTKLEGVQTFLEFRLRRRDLLAGKDGGFTAVGKDERDREEMIFLFHGEHEKRHPILDQCQSCHVGRNSGPGILSVNSFTGSFDNVGRGGFRLLTETDLKRQEDATIAWKRKQFSWGLLTGLRESQ